MFDSSYYETPATQSVLGNRPTLASFNRNQFTLRTILAATTLVGVYLALAQTYGFGRAIVCLFTLALGGSSSLFFAASRQNLEEDSPRIALASGLLGLFILSGTLLIAVLVFQTPPKPIFELQP